MHLLTTQDSELTTHDHNSILENYFNYFTEIEEHYQRRRGTALLLSTLDWALIETWKDAGIPLEAALRGVDATFDKYDRKPASAKTRKINSLAYCSQEVLAAADEMKEAATGAPQPKVAGDAARMPEQEVRAYLQANAQALRRAQTPPAAAKVVSETVESLTTLADGAQALDLEALEGRLTVLEEKIFGALMAATAEDELVEIRSSAERDIAPYRSKMSAAQIAQLHRQYVNKRLLERSKLPRLSLFYMP